MESRKFIAKEIAKMFAIIAVVPLSAVLMGKLLTTYQIAGEVAGPVGMLGVITILFASCAISRIEEIASWSKTKKIVVAIATTGVMMIIVIITTTAACIILDQFYYLLPCTIWDLIMIGLTIAVFGATAYVIIVDAISE